MERRKITEISENRIYRLLERRKTCSNTRFDVFFDTVEDFDGNITEDFLIVRPRIQTAEMVAAVCILPELDGKIGLMKGYRHQLGRQVWQAPAGFVEENESPVEAALRELMEETALSGEPGKVFSLGMYFPDPGLIEGRVALFYAQCTASASRNRVSGEVGTGGLHFLSRKELLELIVSSQDLGGSTTVACFRYLKRALE